MAAGAWRKAMVPVRSRSEVASEGALREKLAWWEVAAKHRLALASWNKALVQSRWRAARKSSM